MRTLRNILFLAVMVAVAGTALAGDAERRQFMDGIYSLEIPAGWDVSEEADGSAATIAPQKDFPSQIIVSSPNTKVEGDFTEYAGLQMGLIFMMLGGGEITGEQNGEFDGHPSHLFEFKVPVGEVTIEGMGMVVNYDGAVCMILALTPDVLADQFTDTASAVINSFKLDKAALAQNRAKVDEISQKMMDDIRQVQELVEAQQSN